MVDCSGSPVAAGMAHIVSSDGCQIYWVNGTQNPYLNHLGAGTHSVTVTAGTNICPDSQPETLTFSIPTQSIAPQWQVTAALDVAYAPCSYPDEGSVSFADYYFTDQRGTLYLADTWAWSDGFTTNEPFRVGLAAQSYTVTISNTQTGCSTVRSYDLHEANNYEYQIQVTPALSDCNGNVLQNGSATIIANSPCPMSYELIYGGAVQSSHTIAGLSIGNHSVVVRTAWHDWDDATTDTYTDQTLSFVVGGQVGGIWVIDAQIMPSASGCLGDAHTGSIQLGETIFEQSDGTASTAQSYAWSDCPLCHSAPRTGLAAGIYEVSISNTTTGCATYREYHVPLSDSPLEALSASNLSADITHSHSNCGDDICDGAVTVAVSGTGSGQYEYEWSDGCQSSPDCSGAWHGNLCSGNYSVTVTDSQTGCTAQADFAVGMYVSQGNISVLTYTAAAELIKPDIRLAPALFDSQTKVEYTLPEDGFVTIKVYNLQGILVETLLSNEYRTAGNYQINDEGGEYANGLYLFSLEVCNRNKAVIGIKW
ncbi:MAG: hypothetical protein IPL33_16790 [Sphingobacteriales bacterium]|nr:hypothetical protein [Sphingobacteriales bacterium]